MVPTPLAAGSQTRNREISSLGKGQLVDMGNPGYSRRIVGWAMQSTLERSLTLRALEMAVTQRRPGPGLIHHSDRGSQYACGDYQKALQRRWSAAQHEPQG